MTDKKANRAIKVRIYPDNNQLLLIVKTFGCCRYYWNAMKEDSQYIRDEYGVWWIPSYADYKKYLPECEFLKEIDSLALANTKINYEKALKNHFDNPSHFGLPKYHARHGLVGSYTTNVLVKTRKVEIRDENGNIVDGEFEERVYRNIYFTDDNKLHLPKLGDVEIKLHRQLPENAILKNVTISRDSAGDFFASLGFYDERYDRNLCDNKVVDKKTRLKAIGLDYSSPKFFVSDLGVSPESFHAYLKAEKRLAHWQKKLSRAKKDSNRYKKLRIRVNRLHRRVVNQRKDFAHKLSTAIADDVDIVCVEDLNLKGIANKKCHLGKHTYDNAYGRFLKYLAYKLRDRGKYLVKVGRFYPSSKTCSHCGAINRNLKRSDRIWTCSECGCELERDINAAMNILVEGVRALLSGEVEDVCVSDFDNIEIVDYLNEPLGAGVLCTAEGCKTMTVLPKCEGFSSLFSEDNFSLATPEKREACCL